MALVPPSPHSCPPAPFTRVRLTSPEQILAAVPYLLGFAPERSVVAIGLRGKQVGLTLRLDLDQLDKETRRTVVSRICSDGATAVVLIFFDPDRPPGPARGRPGAGAMRSLMTALERAGVEVRDALGVCDGRFWSYVCRRASCCPPEGRPIPEAGGPDHAMVAAPLIAHGAAPLASRRELEASVEQLSGSQRAQLSRAYDEVLAEPVQHPIEGWLAAVALRMELPPGPGRALPMSDAVRLIVALDDVLIRDTVVSWTATDALDAVLDLLQELVPLALPPYDVEPLATLAWAAFAAGRGALAAVALERALRTDPGHSLSRMLDAALQGGITPDQLGDVSRELLATPPATACGFDPESGRTPDAP